MHNNERKAAETEAKKKKERRVKTTARVKSVSFWRVISSLGRTACHF